MNPVESPQPQLALQHHIASLSVIQSPAHSWPLGRIVPKFGLKIVPIWGEKKPPLATPPSLWVNTLPLAVGGKKQTCSVLSPKLLKRDVKKLNPVNRVAEFEKRKKKRSVTALSLVFCQIMRKALSEPRSILQTHWVTAFEGAVALWQHHNNNRAVHVRACLWWHTTYRRVARSPCILVKQFIS